MSVRFSPKDGIAKRIAQKLGQTQNPWGTEGGVGEQNRKDRPANYPKPGQPNGPLESLDEDYEDLPPIKCRSCGTPIPREGPGQDVDCPKCGQTHNSFGQMISHPFGRGEDYAGERYEDDY